MDVAAPQLCRLCFTDNVRSLIGIFADGQWSLVDIIGTHIGQVDAADSLPKYICAACRQKVVDFNEFYCVVRTAQRSYTDRLPKIETAHGDDGDDALDAATVFMEPETVLFETDGSAASDSGEMVDDDDEFDDDPRMGMDAAETLEFGSEELMESPDELAGEEAIDGQMDCEVECEEKHAVNAKLAKVSRATINATIGEHFDLSCDICSVELKTLKHTVDHYANEHGVDGYMKCCDMRLKLRFQVEDHVRWHLDPNVFACGECDRIFKSSRSLEVHGHSHMRQSDFPCELCPKLFPTLYRMQKHMKTHLGLRKCLICPERCPGIDALQQHIMDAHNLDGLDAQVEQLRELHDQTDIDTKHMMKVYFDMTCDQCDEGEEFTSLEEVQFHYHEKHGIGNGYVKCCGRRYSNKLMIRGHILKHLKPELFRCIVCSKDQDTFVAFQKHIRFHTQKPINCSVCEKVFLSGAGFRSHMLKAHNIVQPASGPAVIGISHDQISSADMDNVRKFFDMRCEVCQLELQSLQHAKLHYLEHGIDDGYIKCCKLKFRRIVQVNEHLLFHNNPGVFKCLTCAKTFPNRAQLRSHESDHRVTQSGKFTCHVCSQSYGSNTRLEKHMRTHSAKPERTVPCDQCSWKFCTEKERNAHVKRTHQKSTDSYEICEYCAKTFSKRAQVLRHAEVCPHRDKRSVSEQQRHQCNICAKLLSSGSALRQHIRRHTAQPVQCPQCDKRAPNTHALRCHVKAVHEHQTFGCQFCAKMFKSAMALKDHVATHTGEKSYKCSFCPEEFTWRPNMYAHQKKAHPIEYNAQRQENYGAGIAS